MLIATVLSQTASSGRIAEHIESITDAYSRYYDRSKLKSMNVSKVKTIT